MNGQTSGRHHRREQDQVNVIDLYQRAIFDTPYFTMRSSEPEGKGKDDKKNCPYNFGDLGEIELSCHVAR